VSDSIDDIKDSLDRVERRLQIEEELLERIDNDPTLTDDAKAKLRRRVEEWALYGDVDLPDLGDDDDLLTLVRKLRPKGSGGGQAGGAAAALEE
jgi:hypothetical protein